MSLVKLNIHLTYWTISKVWHGIVDGIPSIESYDADEQDCISNVRTKLIARGYGTLAPDSYTVLTSVDR